jgi:GxxExxY protein
MELNDITGQIVSSAIAVHTAIGPGALESAYEACMLIELRARGLIAEAQVALPLHYRGQLIEVGYRLDLLVERQVVVELKAVSKVLPIHEAQLLSYLRLGGFKVGLLLNFHAQHMSDVIKRMVNRF